jgi:hypothetical protein
MKRTDKIKRKRNLQIIAHHHLEHKKQLPVRNESITIHVVDLEGD